MNKSLELIVSKDTAASVDHSSLPHAMMESPSNYSIVFNMLGVERGDIGVDVNEGKREIAVLARKDRGGFRRGFFWVFGVPMDAFLEGISTRYRGGVLEIVIPKRAMRVASA